MSKYKEGATPQEKELIDLFMQGYTVELLAKRVAAERTVKSSKGKETKMPLKIAKKIVTKAILKINFED